MISRKNRKNNLKNKKGGSHVGIIISFVIFVSFLLFFYTIIQPAISRQEKQSFLDSVESKIINEASAELKTASVKIVDSTYGGCLKFEELLEGVGMDSNLISTDEDGSILPTGISEEEIQVDVGEKSFFRVHNSEEFEEVDEELENCQPIQEKIGYNIGLLRSDLEVFESRILDIRERYEDDHFELREDLGILPGNEFGFDFTYSNGTTISVGQVQTAGLDIYISDSQIQYISKEGNREVGTLNVRVW